MSDNRDEPPSASPAALPPEPAPPAEPMPTTSRGIGITVTLAAVLAVVIAAVVASPYWAPEVMPLLPWGAAPQRQEPVVIPRLDQLATAIDRQEQRVATATAATQALDRRLGAFEGKPTASATDVADLRQQIARLAELGAGLSGRLDAVEKTVKAQPAGDPVDTGLLLIVLQIRDAVDTGRPFAAEYDAFTALAADRPKIAEAARPLAEPAKSGVAGRAVLIERLKELAGPIAAAAAPEGDDWRAQTLARLRSLVTIRRISGPDQSAPESAVGAAQHKLAQGDLTAAVEVLDGLSGAHAAAAGPWLQAAKARLAVETALQQVETLLAARLGKAAAPAAVPH